MKTIEIKLSRQAMRNLFLWGSITVLAFIGIFCFMYNNGTLNNYQAVLVFLPMPVLGWMMQKSYKRIKENLPVLIFSELSIEIFDKNNPTIIRWGDLQEWGTKEVKNSTYLWLSALGEKHECMIHNLEKKSKEIEALMEEYLAFYAAK